MRSKGRSIVFILALISQQAIRRRVLRLRAIIGQAMQASPVIGKAESGVGVRNGLRSVILTYGRGQVTLQHSVSVTVCVVFQIGMHGGAVFDVLSIAPAFKNTAVAILEVHKVSGFTETEGRFPFSLRHCP